MNNTQNYSPYFLQLQSRCARECENKYIYNLHEGSGASFPGAKKF